MPLVSRPAAAVDALAQAFALGARWRPMLQAERPLSAIAHTQRAGALRGNKREPLGRRPRGPPSIWQEGGASLGAIIIQTATVLVFERICYGQSR